MASSSKAFLGVENSVKGFRWIGHDADHEKRMIEIRNNTQWPNPICSILARNNISPERSFSYLNPKLRDLMQDPSTFLDMDKAVERFESAVESKEKIAIFADYDVDGACSAAQIVWWLQAIGQTCTIYVPDRTREGFGPNPEAMKKLAGQHSLIICVDCGTTSHESIAAAKDADVIVIDHHSGEEILPPAYAIVNPNRMDETSNLEYLCAAGVVFMFLAAMNRKLRGQREDLCDLMELLDLVALATVADVCALIELNRAFVRRGLSVMEKRSRPGIKALADICKLDGPLNCEHLGFKLGPRINAGGRIGESNLGVRLLATDDKHEAEYLAEQLEKVNIERRQLVEVAIQEAKEAFETKQENSSLFWIASDKWHQGIVGIISSKISDTLRLPSVVISVSSEISKGSARSIDGVDIGDALIKCRNEGLLMKAGGHKMAGGLSVETDRIEEAMVRLSEIVANQGQIEQKAPELNVDGLMHPEAVTVDLAKMLEQAGPYGKGSPSPMFVLPNMQLTFFRTVGSGHLMMTLQGNSNHRISAIAFNVDQSPLGKFLNQRGSAPFHVAGQLKLEHYKGSDRLKFHVEDVAPC